MALIADSFHMLSDVASLIVGFLALQYSTIEAPREVYTYGYARAEVLGALVNAVFLVALCFSIFIEAMKRLVILEEIENPMLVLWVGAIGLVVNLFGMFLFHQTGHGHSHGGMSHSHSHGAGGNHGHSHGEGGNHGHSHGEGGNHGHSHGGGGNHGHSHGANKKGHSHEPLMIPSGKKPITTVEGETVKNTEVEQHLKHGAKSHSTPLNSRDTFSPSLENVLEDEQATTTTIDIGAEEKEPLLQNTNKHEENSNNCSLNIKNNLQNDINVSSEAFNRSHVKNISSEYSWYLNISCPVPPRLISNFSFSIYLPFRRI